MRIVKTKSIPNVDDDRIIDSVRQTCAMIHGAAITEWSRPRRDMVNMGMKIRPMMAEARRRGMTNPAPECSICTNRFNNP